MREGMLRTPGDPGAGAAVQLLVPLGPRSTIAKFQRMCVIRDALRRGVAGRAPRDR
ncbi:MAG: hypothetical protein ACRDT0_01410 [Pseudonocardiaceae bacterium]